jgi:ABC-type branched-subunit amino acid transport system substrate-binding protein
VIAVVCLGVLLVSEQGGTAELSPQERRGLQIFRQGTSAAGEAIKARIGAGDVTVNAALLPCMNCHGADARGRSEGGVDAANITWDALTKPYRVITADSQGRPPYNDKLLVRAITLGFDSDGRDLEQTMPRYIMSRDDIQDLIAYLKVLGTTESAGVTASSLMLMVVLPPVGSAGDFARAIKQVLTEYFGNVNKKGGIYGRQVILEFFNLPDVPAATTRALAEVIDAKQPLALVASYMSGREQDIAGVLEQKRIPSSGAFTLLPPVAKSRDGPLFYVFPGLAGESRALALAFARSAGTRPVRVAVVYDDRGLWRHAADAIVQGLQNHEQIEVRTVAIPVEEQYGLDALVHELSELDMTALFLLTPGETGRRLVQAASARNWRPAYYSPGLLAESVFAEVPPAIGSSLHLSWSTLPADQKPGAAAEFRKLLENADPQDKKYPSEQMHAIAAAKVLFEALRRTGHDVTRRRLVSSLEELYEFSTGLTPDITFGSNRRVGSGGVYVIEYVVGDNREAQRRWIELDYTRQH